MVTSIVILCGVLLFSLGIIGYLAYTNYLLEDAMRRAERKPLDIPDPVRWDYTKDTGWVDADGNESLGE